MAIYHNGRKIHEVWHMGRKVSEVWHMGRLVYRSAPRVEKVYLGVDESPRAQVVTHLQNLGTNSADVTELPFLIELDGSGSASGMFKDFKRLKSVPEMDTSQVTDMSSMFWGCTALETIPQFDTSRVTNMASMFRLCSSLQKVPKLDTSRVRNMAVMFYYCTSLTSVGTMDVSRATNVDGMFRECSRLRDGSVRLIRIDGTKPDSYVQMIENSGLTREPFYDLIGRRID